MKLRAILALLVLALTACGKPDGTAKRDVLEAADVAAVVVETSVYADALAVPTRLEADFGRDPDRQPGRVLEFFGVKPGMDVLDMFSGGGYYTELLAHVVGPDGRVCSHSNEAYLNYVADEFNARHAAGRLPNVEVLMAENNELALEPDSFDAVLLVLSYHDLYYAAPEDGWPAFDVPAFNAELFKGLRPGGVVGIVDHQSEPGAGTETGGTVHRIDADIVIADLTAAGFVLEESADFLRNPEDDYTKNVFDEGLRGKTDRFVLRFRKPE